MDAGAFGLLRNDMVVVNLSGGLGNQMFQYAFGKGLAEKFQTRLYLDTRSFQEHGDNRVDSNGVAVRQYELGCFNINPDFSTQKELGFFFPNNHFFTKAWHKLERLIGSKVLLYESSYGFNPSVIERAMKNTYLHGYWQSHLYFEAITDSIRRDFTFQVPNQRNVEIEQRIKQTNSVSIHVRRGDYISSSVVNSVHGSVPFSFYKQSIDLLSSKMDNILWFVFSDDILWCSNVFSFLDNVTFVSDQLNAPAHYEMYLMSQCKHNIIANSTFSWWAAWLNNNPSKNVIMPDQWFTNRKTTELKLNPQGWKVI